VEKLENRDVFRRETTIARNTARSPLEDRIIDRVCRRENDGRQCSGRLPPESTREHITRAKIKRLPRVNDRLQRLRASYKRFFVKSRSVRECECSTQCRSGQVPKRDSALASLDPLSPIINADFAWTYFCAQQFDKAERRARKTSEIDPQFFLAHYYLGEVLQFQGHLGEAISEFQKAVDLNGDPDSLGMLGQGYARNGQKDDAQKVLLRLNEEAKSRYVAPYAIALVYLGLGEKERALDELERAYQRGDTNYLFVVRVDPMLDDLRGHPRFDALVQKIVDENNKDR
jgi:tetratricopeptide (TPR) repeat protein